MLNNGRGKSRAFTLLEVLVAGGILFIVTAAVVGLSNSIIQGTTVNADQTVTNRWATEGLELTTKVRNDTILKANQESQQQVWFTPAFSFDRYGWHKLEPNGSDWKLTRLATVSNVAQFTTIVAANSPAQKLTSEGLTGYRLICIEAVGAVSSSADSRVNCNTDINGHLVLSDGRRSVVVDCDTQSGVAKDHYCLNSKPSLNRNQLIATPLKVIPAGNAVKVRSVVVWQDKDTYRLSDVATILTNWKSYEQL